MKKIIVTIAPDGATSVETQGFKGKACQDATRQIEQALGAVVSEKKTSEFYQTAGGELKAQG
jgi:hypothetical protein